MDANVIVNNWKSILGISFISLISYGMIAEISKFSSNRYLQRNESEKQESSEALFMKKSVPSSGIMEILISTPESNGKHINKNSLVARYPIQRYSVSDLIQDIQNKEAKSNELKLQIEKIESQKVFNQKHLQELFLRSNEEEKTRIKAEEKLSIMQEKIEKVKKEDSESMFTRSEMVQEIEQLTQILQFLQEIKFVTNSETLENKLGLLKLELKQKIEKDKSVSELQAINTQLLKQKEEDKIKKEKLLQQIAKMKNQSYEYSLYDLDLSEEKEEKSAYGFSMPPIYLRLENSVVNCIATDQFKPTSSFGHFVSTTNYHHHVTRNDEDDDFYSCSESEVSNVLDEEDSS